MEEIAFIEEILTETSQLLLQRHESKHDLGVSPKSWDGEMVTKVDLELQEKIAERLAAEFPGDFLVSEELPATEFPSGEDTRCWILDPLDGTNNFIRGLLPAFGISVAFAVGGLPRAAGVALPGLNSLFLAEKGCGAVKDGQRISVSNVSSVREAKVEVEIPRLSTRLAALSITQEIFRQVGQIRTSGCAVLSQCAVASGESDAYLHATLEPWDYAAGMLIVAEAGGTASRLDGTDIHLFDGRRNILASNTLLHQNLLSLVACKDPGT